MGKMEGVDMDRGFCRTRSSVRQVPSRTKHMMKSID